jgi:hypothetical protein
LKSRLCQTVWGRITIRTIIVRNAKGSLGGDGRAFQNLYHPIGITVPMWAKIERFSDDRAGGPEKMVPIGFGPDDPAE